MLTWSGDTRARCAVAKALGFATVEFLLALLLQSLLNERKRAGSYGPDHVKGPKGADHPQTQRRICAVPQYPSVRASPPGVPN